MAKWLDNDTTEQLRNLLKKMGISEGKVLIDLDVQSIESDQWKDEEKKYPHIKDPLAQSLLRLAGSIPSDRANKMSEIAHEARDSWN